jgi:hypothetical protein
VTFLESIERHLSSAKIVSNMILKSFSTFKKIKTHRALLCLRTPFKNQQMKPNFGLIKENDGHPCTFKHSADRVLRIGSENHVATVMRRDKTCVQILV